MKAKRMSGSKFADQLTQSPATPPQQKKGRSANLIEKRNNAIFHRYYFYLKVHRMRYDMVLGNLMNDFFLSATTIAEILLNNQSVIKNICEAKPSIATLAKLFTQYDWKSKPSNNF